MPSGAMRPALSVVIPVYDNWWLTARCLERLRALRESSVPEFEIIVVDNGSTDETPAAIAAFPEVRYLRHEVNRNFAGACNAGAAAAAAPLTLLLNNDAYPLGDAFTPLVAAFDRPEVAIAGGALFFEDGVTQAAGLVVLSNAHWHYSCRNLPATLDGVTQSRDALGVSGAAMVVRTNWFLEQGGFDESFVNGFEDVDLCLRARLEERAIAYVARARFAHYEAASAGRFDREAENERQFYAHWSAAMASVPRVARGELGAIAVRSSAGSDALIRAAGSDLEEALRAFGHPLVRGEIAHWRRFDRRFRYGAMLGWFCDDVEAPGITVTREGAALAAIRTHGAVDFEVPWLPCVSAERARRSPLRPSNDAACRAIAIAGAPAAPSELDLDLFGDRVIRVTPEMLLSGPPAELACVVHLGLTDEAAFGNVLLAMSGIPSVVLDTQALRALFAEDVALITDAKGLHAAVERFRSDTIARAQYGRVVASDARRRFSPRRSAIRIVDLLVASRFGLERPSAARSNAPF
jgi:GT2 family glycosyltransferase